MNSKTADKRGFTLAELLIVVAIIAVVAAVAIPVFSNLLEKSRRSVDLHTARTVESILANAINDGTIQFPSAMDNTKNYGVFVVIARDKNSFPKDYTSKWQINPENGTLFCGADPSVRIKTTTSIKWNAHQPELQALLTDSGLSINNLKVSSKRSSKNSGWDWIGIYVGYTKGKFVTRIYSGMAGDNGDASYGYGTSNIEKLLHHP